MLCSYEAICTKMEQAYTHLHANPCNVLGNAVGFLSPSSEPGISALANPATCNLPQFVGYRGNCMPHTHQQHWQQPPTDDHIATGNNHPDSVGSSTVKNPHIHASLLSQYFTTNISSDQGASSSTRGASRNYDGIGDPRGLHKDKNAVQGPGDYAHGISLLNSGMQSWDEYCNVRFNMAGATNFISSEYRPGFLQPAEGSHLNMPHPQMELPFWHHHNHSHLLQTNYFCPPFHPGFTWVEQSRSNPGVGSMWNNSTMPFFEGSQDFRNIGCQQGFPVRNPPIFHSPAHSLHHPQPQPVQAMSVPNYNHHPRVLTLNNLSHHRMISTSMEGTEMVANGRRPFPVHIDEWILRSQHHLPQSMVDPSANQMRILSVQENGIVEFPGFHGADSFFDQHRDMRLDIDNMSYEELIALEERIGDVKTGLPEEAILNNLRMSTFPAPPSSKSPDAALVSGTCIICQVEYAENDRIGTLSCGHGFHADCIKQWLMLKNLCPICKSSGLDTVGTEK